MALTMAEVARDYETDGVPSSGPHKIKKNNLRGWGAWVEGIINAFVSGAGTIFVSKASMDANLNYPQFTMAWVLGDATVANNGIYRKIGASGTGNWVRTGDLPYSFIIGSDVGAGTANAIQATTSIPISSSALVWVNVFRANTSAPVTVSFNGGSALTIKTNTGNDVAPGGLTPGMILLGIVSGSTFRLVSDQASASIVAAAEAAKAAAEAAAASINQRIYTAVSNASADTILAVVKRLRTQFFAPNFIAPATLVGGANYRRVSLADLTSYPSASYFRSVDRFMPDGTTDATNGGYWVLDELEPTVTMFGAFGDGTTDDAAAIQAALNWWKLLDDRTVIFDDGKRFLMNSGAAIDCDGLAAAGSVIMRGSVKSAANVAALFTFTNVRGGTFRLSVRGGGQTADYSQADPVGKNEAFRFVNAYGSTIEYVGGQEYAGRVLRVTSATPGSGGFRSQLLNIREVYVNSSAAITDAEATRLANGVGQACYIDTGIVAFGEIGSVICFWDKYGPVIENTTDITLHFMESLWRGNTGFELRGVTSFWGGKLNLGSELQTFPVMRIVDGTAASQNINIEQLFAVGGTYGLRAENVGVISGQGLKIGALFTRLNSVRGVLLSNCSEFQIDHHSYADFIGLELANTCDNGDIATKITASKRQAIIVSSSLCNNVTFRGSAYNGNTDNVASTSLIDISTTNPIFFEGFVVSSSNVDYLYDIVASNNTQIRGGRATVSGGGSTHNQPPKKVRDVIGWATENQGSATILSGGTTVVVNHGLVTTPGHIVITGQLTETKACWITSRTSTQFTVNVPSAVPGNTTIFWRASVDYAG